MAAPPTDFLAALFGDTFPAGLKAALWTKGDKTSHYLTVPGDAEAFAGGDDVYVAACLSEVTPSNRRLKARDAKGIGGFWIDVDLPGPEDPAGKKVARDRDEAMELIEHALEPTMLVNSGYGIQAWWLLTEPWVFAGDEDREQAARIEHGWEVLHRNRARAAGFNIDSVHDLARVMRLPGTRNSKGDGAPVEIISLDGPRYDPDEVGRHALSVPVPAASASSIKVNPDASFPMVKFEALRENLPMFGATWEHNRRDRDAAGWSMSEYDLSLANLAARAGWKDDEIAALLVAHRKKHEGEGSEKAARSDYLAATISKARGGVAREERDDAREQALEKLAEIGDSPEPPPAQADVLAHFNMAIGGGLQSAPVFKEIVQYSTDPDTTRYVLITDNGEEVNVGSYANLRQPRRLDERIGPATGFVMETVKDNETWRAAIRGLLKVRQVREEPEEPVIEWVRRFVTDRLGGDRNHAAIAREPFEEDGFVHVRIDALAIFVRGVLRQRIGHEADLKPLLRKAGFEETRVHYQNEAGKRTTAAYWRIDKSEIE